MSDSVPHSPRQPPFPFAHPQAPVLLCENPRVPPCIELRNLSKTYGSIRALDNVSLTIGSGITGLLGLNGAGKSTLIKTLLGLVRADSGEGRVLGHDLRTQTRMIRQGVGYMPEDDCYIQGLTGIELMHFAARLAGQAFTEGLRRSHEILDFCGVEQERYRNVETYSTGMRQKLKFAQALVHDPPLLILDEPTSGLDPQERVTMLRRIRTLAEQHDKSVVISTHILPDVQAICDSVLILVDGHVKLIESLEPLRQTRTPTFHIKYISHPEAFVQCVESQGMQVELGEQRTLQIVAHPDTTSNQILAWVKESEFMIQSLTRSKVPLEQVFASVVNEVRDADS